MINLILKDIKDEYVRENFKRVSDWVKSMILLNPDWRFFEIEFTQAETNYRLPHRLGYRPKDIIVTSITNSEAVIFNYDLFDNTHIDMTVTGECTIRFFAGTYRGMA